jgi:hypothetical protein
MDTALEAALIEFRRGLGRAVGLSAYTSRDVLAVHDAKLEEACKRHLIAHLILDLLVREIVERLQDEHAKHHDRVDRFATGFALLRLLRRQHHSFDRLAEALPRYKRVDRLQRIALRRQRLKPLVRIEEPELPHRMPSLSDLGRSLNLICRQKTRAVQLFEVPLCLILAKVESAYVTKKNLISPPQILITSTSSLQTQADDYPPSRPNFATLLIAFALVFDVVVLIARSRLSM